VTRRWTQVRSFTKSTSSRYRGRPFFFAATAETGRGHATIRERENSSKVRRAGSIKLLERDKALIQIDFMNRELGIASMAPQCRKRNVGREIQSTKKERRGSRGEGGKSSWSGIGCLDSVGGGKWGCVRRRIEGYLWECP